MNIYALELDNDLKGIEKRKKYIEELIRQLNQPDLVVLPELSLCSYMGSTDVWKYADENSKNTSKWAKEIACKYNTNIAVGYLEKRNGDYYNSYMIAGKEKVYGVVRKSEGESYIFKTGEFPNIISTPFGNVAVGICYDSRRKHIYNNIKDKEISIILFPHGCPSDPNKEVQERKNTDFYCSKYMEAFHIPVIFVNSVGKLDYMMGKTGEMMMKAGFALNGLSKIYSKTGKLIKTTRKEVYGIRVNLISKTRQKDIKFYGNDIIKGNWLFRRFIIVPDTKTGKRFYEQNKTKDLVK